MPPAWAESNRRSRLPSDWNARRRRILERDGHHCQWVHFTEGERSICGADANEVDHIKNNDDHSDENLRALCHAHHAQKTQRESWAVRNANWKKTNAKFRRVEEHPALAYMRTTRTP